MGVSGLIGLGLPGAAGGDVAAGAWEITMGELPGAGAVGTKGELPGTGTKIGVLGLTGSCVTGAAAVSAAACGAAAPAGGEAVAAV